MEPSSAGDARGRLVINPIWRRLGARRPPAMPAPRGGPPWRRRRNIASNLTAVLIIMVVLAGGMWLAW